jgi:hypothetical protein
LGDESRLLFVWRRRYEFAVCILFGAQILKKLNGFPSCDVGSESRVHNARIVPACDKACLYHLRIIADKSTINHN